MADQKLSRRDGMAYPELLAWAWSETPPVHRRTANLLIHIFAVPLFVVGHILLVVGLFSNKWLLFAALACVVVPLAFQSFGHSLWLHGAGRNGHRELG